MARTGREPTKKKVVKILGDNKIEADEVERIEVRYLVRDGRPVLLIDEVYVKGSRKPVGIHDPEA